MMTTYTAITDAEIDQDSPITQTLMTKYRDNLLAVITAGPGSPLAPGIWHPYDMAVVGDGADGVIWDHAVDGSVAEIESPDFDDYFEYLFVFEAVTTSFTRNYTGSPTTVSFAISLYKDTDAAYQQIAIVGDTATTVGTAGFDNVEGQVHVKTPFLQKTVHATSSDLYVTKEYESDVVDTFSAVIRDATKQSISKVKFGAINATSGSFTGGKVKMYRRLASLA